MKIRITSKSGVLPEYATENASGMDVRAYLEGGSLVLKKGAISLVSTGLCIEIPEGYEGQMRARSGLAMKHGITLVNAVGTIDADYRGELKIPLINLGSEDFVINDGDRIAQLVISRYYKAELEKVEELDSTARGEGGFGHTGVG